MNLTPLPERQRAYAATEKAIREGRIAVSETCEDCGQYKPLVAHHVDYNDPENIEWLCGSCHKLAHIRAGEVFHWRTGKPITTTRSNGRLPRKA